MPTPEHDEAMSFWKNKIVFYWPPDGYIKKLHFYSRKPKFIKLCKKLHRPPSNYAIGTLRLSNHRTSPYLSPKLGLLYNQNFSKHIFAKIVHKNGCKLQRVQTICFLSFIHKDLRTIFFSLFISSENKHLRRV